MIGDVAVLISWLTLVGLICQLYLQRTHNEKSLKPLGQIDLEDRQGHLYVRITNNGLGPMIVDRLVFRRSGKTYTSIEDCLAIDHRSYTCINVDGSVRKVILPNSSLTIFETRFEVHEDEAAIDQVRQQLAPITLQVEGRDIYGNSTRLKRNFDWFVRYMPEMKRP